MQPALSTLLCLVALAVLQRVAAGREEPRDRTGAFIGYSEKGHAKHGAVVVLETEYGVIRIKPYTSAAPQCAELVLRLAATGKCAGCNFYRHEHVAQKWGVDGFYGPPYALLQGSLDAIGSNPPFENAVPIRPGHVCFIPNCREFFIATGAHTEWGAAHAVWGEVDDASLSLIDQVPFEPSFTRTDNSNPPIVTTWLNNSIPFSIRLEGRFVGDTQLL